MSEQKNYWASIIESYKSSNLSQPEFCKQNSLSWNQFQYRLHRHKLLSKGKSRTKSLEAATTPVFEAITIANPSLASQQVKRVIELAILLPNQIRCEIKVELNAEFSSLLKQLVSLC